MVYFFNIVSPAVHTSSIAVLHRLDFRGIEVLIVILGKSPLLLQIRAQHRSDTASQPSVFHVGEQKIDQENMEGDQPVQSHSQAPQPLQPHTCVQEHCPGETGLPWSVFQAVLKYL